MARSSARTVAPFARPTRRAVRAIVVALVLLGLSAGVYAVIAASKSTLAVPTISTRPANPTSATSATFAFTGPRGSTFQCRLDATVFAACTSLWVYAGPLAQGSHTFQVRSVSGSVRSNAASYTWTVDTVAPPGPVLTQTPTDPTPDTTNTFAWTDTEADVISECSVANGAWSACSSPYTYVIGTENNVRHQFGVRAMDAAGNTSTSTSYKYRYRKTQLATGVSFAITGTVGGLSIGVWKPIAVTLTNPNAAIIYVTALTVTAAQDSVPGGCASSGNLELQPSSISSTQVVAVPAGGSVVLPAQGASAPQIRLRNLPTVNQDVCKMRTFALTYSGTARS